MTHNELAAATAVDYDPFAGAPLSRLVPTTAPQREVWLASRLEPEASLAYNEAVSLNLKGLLDVPALEWALQGIVDRHEALRATFSGDGEGLFVAGTHDDADRLPRCVAAGSVRERRAHPGGVLAHRHHPVRSRKRSADPCGVVPPRPPTATC